MEGEKPARPDDIVRLFEALQQNLDEKFELSDKNPEIVTPPPPPPANTHTHTGSLSPQVRRKPSAPTLRGLSHCHPTCCWCRLK